MLELPSPLWLLLIIPCGFLIFLFFVARFERRQTRPYVPASGSQEAATEQYLLTVTTAMLNHQFQTIALARQASSMIAVNISFWMSEDNRSIAMVGAGKVAGSATAKTSIYTPLADGTYLLTLDNNDAGDLSGLFRTYHYVGVTFDELWACHQRRLSKHNDALPWPADASVETFNDLLQRRTERLVERRRAYWMDADKTAWRHSSLGAFLCCGEFLKQLFAAVTSPRRLAQGR